MALVDLRVKLGFLHLRQDLGLPLIIGGLGTGAAAHEAVVEFSKSLLVPRSLVGLKDLFAPSRFELFVRDSQVPQDRVELDVGLVGLDAVDAGVGLHEQPHLGAGAGFDGNVAFKLPVILAAGIDAGLQS